MATKKSIRVTTYNVHFGNQIEKLVETFIHNKNLVASDVILLQELESFAEEGQPRAEKIAQALNLNFYYAEARPVSRLGKTGSHGLAVLSRFPITAVETIKLPFYKMQLLKSRPRIALVVHVLVDGKKICICNIHLDARLNSRFRILQMSKAVEYLKRYLPEPLILAGDFNTFPFMMALDFVPVLYYNQYKRLHNFLLKHGFVHRAEFKGSTMRRGWLGMKLDHIYSFQLPVLRCGVEKKVTISDHKPVWADLLLTEN